MASNTAQTQYRRHIRNKNAGVKRKRQLENQGTTPAFPVHTPEVDANAPAAQLSPKPQG